MRQVKPGTFVRGDTLRLARKGKPRMALVADVMHTCDIWLEDAQSIIGELLTEGKLIEEETGWIKTAPTTSRSRSGTPFNPYHNSTVSSSEP